MIPVNPSAVHATQIFDDEFDGTALGRVWSTCYPWTNPKKGCTNGGSLELEWYLPGNVSISNGYLKLTAKPQTAYAGHPYTSGMIATGGKPSPKATFSYLYGYAEARIKLPRGAGMWPAFWLVPTNRTWPPENRYHGMARRGARERHRDDPLGQRQNTRSKTAAPSTPARISGAPITPMASIENRPA